MKSRTTHYRPLLGQIAVAMALVNFTSSLGAQEEYQKERAERLEQCARAIENISIDRVDKPRSKSSDGRQYSKASELHVRFQKCVSGTENNGKDGALVFGIQCSGFTSVVDPRAGGGSVKDAGSDVVPARVTIAGLMDKDVKRPKADIHIPSLKHGSTFPAVQLARDEIALRLEFFFPGIDISGIKRFDEKQLEIHNQSEEPINVWLHYRTRRRQEQGYEWFWIPDEPGSERALKLSVVAGKTIKDAHLDGEPIKASRVRIWAESESGEVWDDFRRKDLRLIEPNSKLDNARAYHAEEIETYRHVIKPSGEPRLFNERVLTLRNDTPEELQVRLSYYTTRAGQSGWRSAFVVIQAGETMPLRGGDDMRLRASRIRFTAESINRLYEKHAEALLYMVEKSGERRIYRGNKIGEFIHVFDAAGETRSATVVADNVPIQRGTEIVASTQRDQSFKVLEQREDWVRVQYQHNGEDKAGWIQKNFVDYSRSEPQASPSTALPQLRVIQESTDVKLGDRTIARLSRGGTYELLDEGDGWVRVQVTVDGRPMQGWVNRRHVDVVPLPAPISPDFPRP